jgi:hypothetical protein
MKRLFFILIAFIAISCGDKLTTVSQDTQMLQSKYPTVYRINAERYITADSNHVYDVRVTSDGKILSTVKIK